MKRSCWITVVLVVVLGVFFWAPSSTRVEAASLFSCWPGYPALANSALNHDACCWYASKTCCPSAMTKNGFLTFVDGALQGVLTSMMGGTPNTCYYYIAAFLCAICDPATATFLSGSPTSSPTMTVCNAYCTNGFNACTDFLPPGIVSGAQFCQLLKGNDTDDSQLRLQISTTNTNCFGLTLPLNTIQNGQCLPGQKGNSTL